MMEPADRFLAALEGEGFDFFCGVPCSYLAALFRKLEKHPAWVAATREDVAVGLATGAWLGGRSPVVLLQNSGLGTALNAIVSLAQLYGIPMLLVVSWRGENGRDAPEHLTTGEVTPRLLELLGVPFRVLTASRIAEDVAALSSSIRRDRAPAALVVRKGVME